MRVKRGVVRRRRHNKMLKLASGYRGRRNGCFKLAKLSVEHGWRYAYRDRKAKKRDFRSLWIMRINAAARLCGLSYSQFMHGLTLANIELDRKALAEVAATDSTGFSAIADKVKAALAA
jgi:large subunit ribosomal protein L20